MASLPKAQVTVRDSWYEGGAPVTKKTKVLSVTLDLSTGGGYGGATNTILASVFGLTTIREVTAVQTDDNSAVYLAAPSYDGTKLFLYDLASDEPADVTDTVRCLVKGT